MPERVDQLAPRAAKLTILLLDFDSLSPGQFIAVF
jgi:hypothetical protein